MKRPDKRIRQVGRQIALSRRELRAEPKPEPVSQADIEAAIRAGKFHRIEKGKRNGSRPPNAR